MRKRIIALLLALILTVGLLPTVALAAGETANTDVVPGSIGTDGKWSQTPPTQPKVDGVKKVDKTAEKVAGTDNQYKVTLTVVLEQTEEEQKPGAAATVLVLDTSGSMAYCAECGAEPEEDCEHNYAPVPGMPSKNETYYYKTNENGQVRFGTAHYCKGQHTLQEKHAAGWFKTKWYEDNHNTQGDALSAKDLYIKKSRASRLDAAKTAAQNFLRIYSGLKFDNNGNLITGQTARNLGRYVSVVTFATGVTLRKDWVDVSDPIKYAEVLSLFTSNNLKADGGTNLNAGLTYAEYLLKKDTVKNATKNVIALTDGEPTYYLSTNKRCIDRDCDCKNGSTGVGTKSYYVHGHGNACSTDTKSATDNAANALKNNNFSDLYTICFGVAEDKMKRQWNDGGFLGEGHWSYWDITVGQYLRSIASSKDGKRFAYTADNAEQLNTAFAAITDTIVSGLDTGTVRDKLPTAGITAKNASGEEIEIPETWDLERDFEKKTETPTTTGDKKVTTYTYTKTYYVTIDPEKAATTEINGEKYAPLNGETTLTVEVAGEEKTIPFPIPAGKVTMPSYTVTFKDGANEAVFKDETQQVEYGKPIPSHADPVRPGYNFTGWTSEPANYQPGTGTMPANNITFTAQWTEKTSVTISYVAKEGGSVNKVSETLNPDTGVAVGSTATASTGYRFVGWYDNEGCTGTALSTDASYTPSKPEAGWADKTYYAKFESLTYTITFKTEDGGKINDQTNDITYPDLTAGTTFPAVPTTKANTGYYFLGWYDESGNKVEENAFPEKVTGNATYTAKWLSYNSINLDLTGKIQKTLNSDVELSNQSFTINVKQTGAEIASATATATVSATTVSGTGYTGSAPFQKDDFKLTFKAHGTYNYSIVEEQPVRPGMTYDDGFATTGHTMTVVVEEDAAHALSVASVTVDGTAIALTDTDATWLTITNTYTEPKEPSVVSKTVVTTDMVDTLPVSVSNDIAKFKSIKTVDILYPVDNGEASTLEVPYGTKSVTLLYKITVNAGTKTSMQFEDVGAECVSIVDDDNVDVSQAGRTFTVQFYSGVTTADIYVAKTYTNLVFDSNGECTVENVISEEIKATTTVTEKDPNKLTINFADYVQKELTATGTKTASNVDFTVDVKGKEQTMIITSAEGEEAISTYADEFDPKYSRTLTAHFDSITGGEVKTTRFTGTTVEIDHAGYYTFFLGEEKGTRTGVTYDETRYTLYINVRLDQNENKLYVSSMGAIRTNADGTWENIALIEMENGEPVRTTNYITFHNTIDTGKDDYYPIIIPTIINKDTGMLNKTDHFAYVIGYPDGTVHPNGQITRAEVATIFFRLLKDEVRDGAFTTSNSYSDVAYGKWYNNPISTMSALGIITGYPDGTFKPNKPITRAEFAAIAARFDETQSGKSATFSDVIGHWAAKEIGIAYANEWIKGYPDGTFKPDQNITRAEAMTMINRVLERKPESPADLLTNMNKWTDNMDTSKWYYLDVQEATNSHGYTRKTFNYELWRQMLPDPDWSRYER